MTRIVGHAWGEEIIGGDANDQIYARGGDDYAAGGWGNDRVFGDAGNDWLYGDGGRDRVGGGAGDDVVWDEYGDYNVLDGGRGNDQVGGVGDLFGRDGDDLLVTSHGGELQGTKLNGGGGHDTFKVGLRADVGTTYDEYDGRLTGLGAAQRITIADFHHGSDKLILTANDPLGNWFANEEFSNGTVLDALDSNGDRALTKDDTYVDATADGKGIDAHFWNVELVFANVQAISAQDFSLTG